MKVEPKPVLKVTHAPRTLRGALFYSLAAVAVAGPLVFMLASTLLPFLNQGYNIIYDAVSSLVFGVYGWLQTAGFYSFGVSLMALAAVVFIKTRLRVNPASVLLSYIGLGFIMIGAFKGQGPGQVPGLTSMIHEVWVGVVVVAFPIACLLMARHLKNWGYRAMRIYTIAVGIFAAFFMLLGGPILALHFSLTGIFERVLLWNGELWIILMCVQLVAGEVRKRRRLAYAYARQKVETDITRPHSL